ncbi:hypothetical protein M5689_021603 [Euphorbia peplus]|nr:hypothetical protein M5689_021603 [Euphorbia peplus]
MSFLVVLVIIGSFIGESRADFKKFKNCMEVCLVGCAFPPWTPICPASCIGKCLIHQAELSSTHFCNLGCATSLCSKFITRDDPHLDEVESCVNICSGSCKNNYVSSTH